MAVRRRSFTGPVSAQNQYSLLRREVEQELLPTCERLGIGVLPYFPLASGLLTGKYKRCEPRPEGTRLSSRDEVFTDETFDRLEALERFAEERGIQLLDVAIGGLAAQPAVTSVIAGATKPEQVRANAAAGEWEPSAADLQTPAGQFQCRHLEVIADEKQPIGRDPAANALERCLAVFWNRRDDSPLLCHAQLRWSVVNSQ